MGAPSKGTKVEGTAGGVPVDVNIVGGGGGTGGTALTDKGAFTEGGGTFTPVGGVVNDTISADPSEDQAAAARITPKRALHVNPRDNSGAELGVLGNPVRTDPVGSTNQPIVGTKSNDTGAPGGTNLGVLPAVATANAPAYQEGNQAGLSVDLSGALRTAVPGYTSPQHNKLFEAALAGESSIDLDATTIPAMTIGKLISVVVSSSVAVRWDIKTRDGGVELTRITLYTSGVGGVASFVWNTPDKEFITLEGNGDDENFRITATSLSQAPADVHATIFWDEVPG